MHAAPVNRILRSSSVDGPGNRAAVFLQGCNFNCVYCHNGETINLCNACGLCLAACPARALSAGHEGAAPRWDRSACVLCDECIRVCPHSASPRVRLLDAEAAVAEIGPSLPFIRGITVSGGECTLYPEFLTELGERARALGKSFFLDTNGSHDFSNDSALFEVTGGVMIDIKADPENPEEYRAVSGAGGEGILENAEWCAERGKLYEVRTVVSPGLFDAANVVEKVCRRLRGAWGWRYKIIRYRPAGVRPENAGALRMPDDALLGSLGRICGAYRVPYVIV
ncbi:MAG: YjjW family glycine radical enzyme activase [Treponema sp.]|jgi:pyruvate formate lyase activating enzyme|nr:YjjW family glycine radical enzyme activase [Treponema sp.]